MNLSHRRVVNHEWFAISRDAVKVTVRVASCAHIASVVNRQTNDVGLPAVVKNLSLAFFVDLVDLSLVSRSCKEIPLAVNSHAPNKLVFRIKESTRFAFGAELVDLPVRRRCDVESLVRVQRQ